MIEAELPDGTVLEFPEGTSQDVIQRVVKQRLGATQKPSFGEMLKQEVMGSLPVQSTLGAIRGAANIGATLLKPVDVAAEYLSEKTGVGGFKQFDRRAATEEGLKNLGAEPESLSYQGGKLATEIAGTAGAPGILAKGAQALRAAPAIVNALRGGGLVSPGIQGGRGATLANAGLRTAGGATTGATAAGLVNPEEADTGAIFGAALPLAQGVVRGAGWLASKIIGTSTGAGDEALSQAYQAGKAGGAQAQAFRENMRGQSDMLQVLDDAKANLNQLKLDRLAQYKATTEGMRSSTKQMDMQPIFKAVDDVADNFMFQGQARNPQAAEAIKRARETINNWAQLDPVRFHTPEGIDALKQQIGALRESVPFEQRSARNALDRIYQSIGKELRQADPQYAKAMADYSQASDLIDEVSKSLSLNERASADTAMRKLQSLMRNNANTNYGARLQAAQALEAQGGRQIMPAIAGQSLSSWTPRAMQAATATGLGGALALTGNIPQAILAAASSSPRLMGETFYGAGRAAGFVNPALVDALRRGAVTGVPVLSTQ